MAWIHPVVLVLGPSVWLSSSNNSNSPFARAVTAFASQSSCAESLQRLATYLIAYSGSSNASHNDATPYSSMSSQSEPSPTSRENRQPVRQTRAVPSWPLGTRRWNDRSSKGLCTSPGSSTSKWRTSPM
eukprot:TRINITY_DN19764_c0_g1_i1.p2 TRINITY_DN19764_c0_g1~~TRINITY_DN19764_c0_g1_i1.p2  ORF type:complete len:129 (-),score=0.47 TRINITY_DN19764_c0_g1_i1:269-655(-)